MTNANRAMLVLLGVGLASVARGQCQTRWEQIWEIDGLIDAVEEYQGDAYVLVRDSQAIPVVYQRTNGAWSPVTQPASEWVKNIKALRGELYAVGGFDLDHNPLTPSVGVVRRTATGWDRVPSPAESAREIDVLEGDLVVLGFNEEFTRGALFRRDGEQWSTVGDSPCQSEGVDRFAMAADSTRLVTTFCMANSPFLPAVYENGVWSANGSANQYSKVFASSTDLLFADEFPDSFSPPLFRLVGDQWERLGPADIFGRVMVAREIEGVLWIGGWLRNRRPPYTVNAEVLTWNGTTFVGVSPQPPVSGAILALGRLDGKPAVALAPWQGPPRSQIYVLTTTCSCDSIDFNNDGSAGDPTDIDAFFSVFSEGACVPAGATCNDVDFNNDGSVFDPCDVESFLLAFADGPCTACGE